jgi:hypothetical protein
MSSTFVCECCSFSSTKKSHYTEHLASKKHLAKMQGSAPAPIAVPVPLNDNTVLLEKIKMLEMMIEHKNQVIEQKDATIKVLQESLSKSFTPVPVPVPVKQEEKVTVAEKISMENKDAITINEFKTYFVNEEYNHLIQNVDGGSFKTILKSIDANDYKEGFNSLLEMICNAINVIPKNDRPIFCTDKRRCNFLIKTENGWTKYDNGCELDTVLLSIIKHAAHALTGAVCNIINGVPATAFYKLYGKHQGDFSSPACNFGRQEILRLITVTSDDYKRLVTSLKHQLATFTNKENSVYNYDVSSFSTKNKTDDEPSEEEKELIKKQAERKQNYLQIYN